MLNIKAEIITIGDEILIGQVVDTNSAWIGQELNKIGIRVFQISSVSDNRQHILSALSEASSRAELVLLTGGLGPTRDDITKHTLCDYFQSTLVFSEEAYEDVAHLFRQRGRDVTAINRGQAEVPANAQVLRNKVGTAPGMWFEEKGVVYVSMPGVPYEMKYLMEQEVIPRIRRKFNTPEILHRTLLTQGIGESFLAERLSGFEDRLPEHIRLAYLPSAGAVRLRLSGYGVSADLAFQMEKLSTELAREVEEFLFGYEDDTLQQVVGRVLLQNKLTVSTAESCTGGNIAHLLTSVPGASAWYMGSTVTYSYESKTDVLGVPSDLIHKHGAVSEEVVLSMVKHCRRLIGTDCAVATSGIAGPGGGTPEKPVGTVWIGVAVPGKVFAKKVLLGDNRLRTIEVASQTALNLLRKALLEL